MGKRPSPEPPVNPEGTVSPRIGAYFTTLVKEAKKRKIKPNTLARQLLIFALRELVDGKITLPEDSAIRIKP